MKASSKCSLFPARFSVSSNDFVGKFTTERIIYNHVQYQLHPSFHFFFIVCYGRVVFLDKVILLPSVITETRHWEWPSERVSS